MTNYELTYLISQEASEEQREAISQDIALFIKDQGGVLESASNESTKKILGYPIRKQTAAYMGTLVFSFPGREEASAQAIDKALKNAPQDIASGSVLEPEQERSFEFPQLNLKLEKLKEKIKEKKEILRFIIIKKPRKEKRDFRNKRKNFIPARARKQKIELKKIDEKIEEMLK